MQLPSKKAVLVLGIGRGREWIELAAVDGDDGKPVRRFMKDLISTGTYTHPTKGWTLDVKQDDLKTWETNIGKFLDRGIKMPVTVDHKHSAEAVRGVLVGVERIGDTLFGVHEIHGEKGIALTEQPAVEVSVEIDTDYVAAKDAEELGSCITASSLVQRPIVPGQDTFKIAASRTGVEDDAPALKLDKNPGATKPMKTIIEKLNKKFGLSIAEDADEAAIVEAVEAVPEDQTDEVKELGTVIVGLKAKVAAAPAKIELSRTERVGAKKNLGTELNGLVDKGHITKACRDKLEPVIGTDLMLAVADGADDYAFGQVIEALKENDALKLTEQTEQQLIEASTIEDKTPSADPDMEERAKTAYA